MLYLKTINEKIEAYSQAPADGHDATCTGEEWRKCQSGSHTGAIIDGAFVLTENLAAIKAAKLAEINAEYEQRAALVKADTPADEVQTWPIQQKEWEAWIIDQSAPTPFIDGLAAARKMDKTELMNKIGAKVVTFRSYMGDLTGRRQHYEDILKAATAAEEVEAISW